MAPLSAGVRNAVVKLELRAPEISTAFFCHWYPILRERSGRPLLVAVAATDKRVLEFASLAMLWRSRVIVMFGAG